MSCERNAYKAASEGVVVIPHRPPEDIFWRLGLVGERAHELSNEKAPPKYTSFGEPWEELPL